MAVARRPDDHGRQALLQSFLNGKLRAGRSVRSVQIMRQVLSAALSRAVREELLARNVARLVELPEWEPAEAVRPGVRRRVALLAVLHLPMLP